MKNMFGKHSGALRILRPLLTVLLVLALVTGCASEGSARSNKKNKGGGQIRTQSQSVQNQGGQSSGTSQSSQSQSGQKQGSQSGQSAGNASSETSAGDKAAGKDGGADDEEIEVEEDGAYTSKEEVAAYLHTFGHLPDNFITKQEARDLGWDSSKGNLDKVAPGKSIGGDRFGNYEGLLPEKNGRKYKECDIDYTGGYRDAKRIIFSNDGLIYYTEDHYQSFEQLYE